MMHIGLLIYGSLDTISGGYLYDRQLVHALRASGHRVEIVALPWRNYARHLGDNFSASLLARLRKSRFDLLLQDELNHPSLAWINPRLRHVVDYPVISIVHHLRSSESHPRAILPFYRWIERRYLNSVDGFLYNSQSTCATVTSLLHGPKPYQIAYPAADHHHPPSAAEIDRMIKERAQSQGPLHLLFVGNVIARKGLHVVLQALAQVPRHLWQLHVIGSLTSDRRYTAYVQQLIHSSSLTDQVTLYGRCTDTQIVERYRQCHLYVAPAFEGFGIAYLEAMSFGLPVIAATAGAAHEIVTDGVDGYLVAPTDTTTLAAHITTLCHNRSHLRAMSSAARQRYDRHPTWEESFAPVVQWLTTFSGA
jgi:glycosyltransferase involved in cell wall biosynthesis